MYADKDYYDKNGRLLLAKGAKITDMILEKLSYYTHDENMFLSESLIKNKINIEEISKSQVHKSV